MRPPLSSAEPPVTGKYGFFVIFPIGSSAKHVYTCILCYWFFLLFVFVLCCAEKEEGETGVVID